MYVPKKEGLRTKLLQMHHDDPLAGHFGRARTEELLRRNYHWVNMQEDITKYVKSCGICQTAQTPRHRPYGKLESLPIPSRPFAELSMDFITGLPQSIWKGRIVDAILVIVDRFSKWCLFFPVSTTMDASELAELFHQEVELRYGPPNGIVSDRGSVFTSRFWSKLCYLSKVKLRYSTAFHPQTDGQTERMNQTLEHYLRCFIDAQQKLWPSLLRTAEFACNNAVNSTTSLSPFQALLGFNPNFQIRDGDVRVEKEAPAAQHRFEKLNELREKLQTSWRKATEAQATQYNKRHQEMSFKKNDIVALSTKNLRLKEGTTKKLSPRWIGPFRILECVGKQAYRLLLPDEYAAIHNVFPVSLLQPWEQREGEPEQLPLPELADDDEWEVEEIKDDQCFEDELHYLVKWWGWPSEYNQWVPESAMANSPKIIAKYKKAKKKSS